ncbi:hypothetical protein CTI12_AA472430 [Artemisia annua]|uniref:AB hydrolase-1 domain-containing protein n=1 Tax=Artemisia annua TaxID=35608 RepID=A0A2U1LN69_ARTAN|nr:hypothetical protein CTI12_AA472430 [Artemisia annua]
MSVHPSLEVSGGALDSFLPGFTTLDRPYDAYPVICSNTHVETIFANKLRSTPYVRFRRECLRMKDNGVVSLDWVAGDNHCLSPKSPILILLAGLTGGSGEAYIKHMLLRARNKGWRVVAFNSRGCGNSPVITPKFYSASFTGDIGEVIVELSSRYPDANLYAAGWSLGANILVRYLGQEGDRCLLSGAVSLGNPFNLVLTDEGFHKGFNNVYDKTLGASLSKIFRRHASLFEGIEGEYNIPAALNSKSVREFDDSFTRDANLYAAGWSLGANILVRYLGQEGDRCLLSGAVSLGNPFNLVLTDEGFHKGFNNVYDKTLGASLSKIFRRHASLFEGIEGEYNIPAALNSKSVREFDDSFTRVSFGFKSVDDYYLKSSSSNSIKHVRTPLLCIQAANDPIAPNKGIPREDIEDNPNCMLIVTPKGGHLAWVAGDEAPFGASWTDPVVMDFLEYLEKTKSRSVSK